MQRRGTPAYFFDDRTTQIMPMRHPLHEVFFDMARGMREEEERKRRSPAVNLAGAWAGLFLWPWKV